MKTSLMLRLLALALFACASTGCISIRVLDIREYEAPVTIEKDQKHASTKHHDDAHDHAVKR